MAKLGGHPLPWTIHAEKKDADEDTEILFRVEDLHGVEVCKCKTMVDAQTIACAAETLDLVETEVQRHTVLQWLEDRRNTFGAEFEKEDKPSVVKPMLVMSVLAVLAYIVGGVIGDFIGSASWFR